MSMKSKDLIQQELKESLVQAFKSEDEDSIARAFAEFAESVRQNVMEDYNTYQRTQDSTILAKRGMHPLTSQETKFYEGIIQAMKSANPRQEFTGLDNAFPQTIIDNVIADIKAEHPLLAAIDFKNTSTLTKIVVNKQGVQFAVWGPLNSKITEELSGAIGLLNLTLCKLTAFMPIAKDMLDVGPDWIDAYVRGTLAEATALALELAIVDGTGNNEPIGMDRDVSDGVTIQGGEYPLKKAIVITDLKPITYGSIVAQLVQTPTGKTRTVDNVLLVVNPIDYFTKVMPATTKQLLDGTYANNLFPYPTTVIQSPGTPQGRAIFGIANKYFMGIGAGTSGGKIEFSDEVKFLDDERVYITKLYGNGRALDNNAFVVADISGLQPMKNEVVIDNEAPLKELTVNSSASTTTTGNTVITVSPALNDGNTYKYKTGSSLSLPVLNQILTSGWTAWNGTDEIVATTGNKIIIAEVNATNQCKGVGEATVTSKA
ncbi:phage major capsid protein [Clostridium sp. WILCCON 0269]|uniref:Phage major capsid protein n=1 Tax=Candidatus Clostridium eludens TaxID=3381663 RepID=A0ABW8SLS1_9CLOT